MRSISLVLSDAPVIRAWYRGAMAFKERPMLKMHVRGNKLTVTIPEEIWAEIAAHDGDDS